MKKGIVTTVIAISFFLSAFLTSSAMAGSFGFGLQGTYINVSATGSEKEGTGDGETSAEVKENNTTATAAFFAEYMIGEGEGHGWTLGMSYSPTSATIGARSRTDTQTAFDALDTLGGSDDSGTYEAKATVSKHTTLYVEPTLMWDTFGIFLKAGVARINVNSDERIVFGEDSSSYGDKAVTGNLFGSGITKRFDSGLYYKLEAVSTAYNSLTLTSTSGNKNIITADPSTVQANFALGYRF